jgi:hypothetical protein
MGTGCESDHSGDLSIDPSEWTFVFGGTNDSTKVFTAYATGKLALPLEWSVAKPEMGGILSQSGSNAVYAASSGMKGGNTILVKDQYGNTAQAGISQR